MKFEWTKAIAKRFSFFKRIPYLPILIDEQLKIFTLFFRPAVFQKMMTLTAEIKSWPEIRSVYHKYGGIEFRVNEKEICHMHGDGLVDILVNRKVAQKLIAKKSADEHHVIKNSGWLSYSLQYGTAEDALDIIKQAYKLRGGKSRNGSKK